MFVLFFASKIKIREIESVERFRELELLRFDKQIEVLNQGINLCVNQISNGTDREQSKAARIP